MPDPRESHESGSLPAPEPGDDSALESRLAALRRAVVSRLRLTEESLLHLIAEFTPAGVLDTPRSTGDAASSGQASLLSLRRATCRLDDTSDQAELLARLLEESGAFASRAALLLASEGDGPSDRLRVWNAVGFDNGGLGERVQVPRSWLAILDGSEGRVLDNADCVEATTLMAASSARRGVVVPFLVRDRVAAVLYADQLHERDPFEPDALQLLCHTACQGLELVALRTRRPASTLIDMTGLGVKEEIGEAVGPEVESVRDAEADESPALVAEVVEPRSPPPDAVTATTATPAAPRPEVEAQAVEAEAVVEPATIEAESDEVAALTAAEIAAGFVLEELPLPAAPDASDSLRSVDFVDSDSVDSDSADSDSLESVAGAEQQRPSTLFAEPPSRPSNERDAAAHRLAETRPDEALTAEVPLAAYDDLAAPPAAAPDAAAAWSDAGDPPLLDQDPSLEDTLPGPAVAQPGHDRRDVESAPERSAVPVSEPPSAWNLERPRTTPEATEPTWDFDREGPTVDPVDGDRVDRDRVDRDSVDRGWADGDWADGEEAPLAGSATFDPEHRIEAGSPAPASSPGPYAETAEIIEVSAEEPPAEDPFALERVPQPPPPPPVDEAFRTEVLDTSAFSRAPRSVSPPPPAPASRPPEAPRTAGNVVAPPADFDGPGWAFTTRGVPGETGGPDRLHDEAKRLARLLVSEIKLYNEEQIDVGRRRGNIYEQLRDDIDRSRRMYQERVDQKVRDSTDYFRDELIRSLAGGDAELMGL